MELQAKLPENLTLISVVVPRSWVQDKKNYGLPWRRIIKMGLDSANPYNVNPVKLQSVIKQLETQIQETNQKLEGYEAILQIRQRRLTDHDKRLHEEINPVK